MDKQTNKQTNMPLRYTVPLGDDEIHYELADDFEEISLKQRFSRAVSHSNDSGISNARPHQVPVKYPDTGLRLSFDWLKF